MANNISANIDKMEVKDLEGIYAISKAITENGNIGVSLGTTRATNIKNILEDTAKKISEAKDENAVKKLEQQALKKVKTEFKRLLNNFDVDKLNKIYGTKFVASKVSTAMDNVISEFTKATGIDEDSLRLVFMESIIGKSTATKTVSDSIIDTLKKKLVDGSAVSSMGTKNAIKSLSNVPTEVKSAIDTVSEMVQQAEKDTKPIVE